MPGTEFVLLINNTDIIDSVLNSDGQNKHG